MPTQNPVHKEHESSSLKKLNLNKKLRGQESMVPYFNIKVKPIQDSKTKKTVTSICQLLLMLGL